MPYGREVVEQRLIAFLGARFRGHRFQPDDDIFELGIVSSVFAFELVLMLEKEYELELRDEDIEIANFRSPRAMADLVCRKLQGASAA
jgi:methoxymalonate biosynthesis acyl carrier protein